MTLILYYSFDYLINGISTPYGLYNAEIWFICKFLIVIKTIFTMSHFIFLFPLFYSFNHSFAYSYIKGFLKNQLYGHLPPITKTIQVRQTRHAGHCWRSKDQLISDVLLWTPAYGQAKAGRPARTYIQQLCEDTGCSLEDLPEAKNNREKWRERIRDIRASGTTWWWWWWWWYQRFLSNTHDLHIIIW